MQMQLSGPQVWIAPAAAIEAAAASLRAAAALLSSQQPAGPDSRES
jgi:hypothetical protein